MTTIVMDTNILFQENLISRNMQVLGRLAKAGLLSICIPELVKREYVTHRISDSVSHLLSAHDKITEVMKSLAKEDKQRIHLGLLQEQIKSNSEQIEKTIQTGFDSWEKSNNVRILEFDNNFLTDVFDDYFAGTGVYRKPKHREDIPDAFINACIQALIREVGELDVICKDGAFRKHITTIKGCKVNSDLQEYLAQPQIVEMLKGLDAESEIIDAVKEFVGTDPILDILQECLLTDPRMMGQIYLIDSIDGSAHIELDHFALSINGANEHTIQNLTFGNVSFIDGNVCSIECSFTADAYLSYCADFGSYVRLNSEQKSRIFEESMNGDGICDLSEIREAKFHGYLNLHIPYELSLDEIKTHMLYVNTPKRKIEVELDIREASILPSLQDLL